MTGYELRVFEGFYPHTRLAEQIPFDATDLAAAERHMRDYAATVPMTAVVWLFQGTTPMASAHGEAAAR